jgi:hypothetical protein
MPEFIGIMPSDVQKIIFVAAGFSLRHPGGTPGPPRKFLKKYSL